MSNDAFLIPGSKIDFDQDTLDLLGRKLAEIVDELEGINQPLLDNIDKWWEWYRAKPLTETRQDPWAGASNVVIPLIRWHSDAIAARRVNTIFALPKVWIGKTQNDEARQFVEPVVDFLNWAGDNNEYDLLGPCHSWFHEAIPIGSSVMAQNWVTKRRQMFVPGKGGRPKPVTVNMGSGPMLEQIPRHQILWDPAQPIQEAEVVVRQSFMTWGRLTRMGQLAGWDQEAIEASRHHSMTGSSRAEKVRRSQQQASGQSPQQGLSFAPHDIREIHVEWPLLRSLGLDPPKLGKQDADVPTIPLVVTIHKDSRKVLRVVSKPYLTAGWTFYEDNFRKGTQDGPSDGVARSLYHMQAAATTMLNQAIDTISRSNSITGITTDRNMVDQKWALNKLLFTSAPIADNFQAISLNKLIQPDVVLIQLVMGIAERLTGINDPNLGKEIRLGGHPSPATSTLTLLQESREMDRAQLRLTRRTMGRMAEDQAMLYQQFESQDNGKIERAIGVGDAAIMKQWLFPTDFPVGGTITFDLRAVSETLNPEQLGQKALRVSQTTALYFSQVMQALDVAAKSKAQGAPEVAEAALASIRAVTKSHKMFLEAADIDDVGEFLFKLQESDNDPRVLEEIQGAVGGRLQELEAGSQNGQLPGVPTGPDGVPISSNGGAGGSGF